MTVQGGGWAYTCTYCDVHTYSWQQRSTIPYNYKEIFVLKIFYVTIIHIKNFSRTAVMEAIFSNNSDLAVLAVLSPTCRPSFQEKSSCCGPTTAVTNVKYLPISVRSFALCAHAMCCCRISVHLSNTLRRYFRLESGWKSIVASSETATYRAVNCKCHVFATVIYPLFSSVFANYFA